jgi:glycosyltransferase involved in cell wall biosynthesis
LPDTHDSLTDWQNDSVIKNRSQKQSPNLALLIFIAPMAVMGLNQILKTTSNKTDMKILHIAYSGLGGHGNVFFSMADADTAKQNQYEVIFFGTDEVREGYTEMAKQRNIPWFYVPKKPGLDLGAYSMIEKIIRDRQPDVIFLHSSSYIFPVKKATLFISKKIRIIVRESHANHLKTKQNWLGLCISLITAGKVVFLSIEYRDVIKKKLSFLFSEKRTAVIPNGIDLDVYKPAERFEHESLNIGMQSRLSENKDHKTLINAFALLLKTYTGIPVKLFIAGDGTCRPQLEKQVQDLNIGYAVIFTGMLEETSLPAFINSLDIYVHATLGETMSTAIMQVMACRKAIVASNVLGVDNMIQNNETGLLVPVKNAEALCEAVLKLIDNTKLADTLADNACNFAKDNYSNKIMLERYNKIFNA